MIASARFGLCESRKQICAFLPRPLPKIWGFALKLGDFDLKFGNFAPKFEIFLPRKVKITLWRHNYKPFVQFVNNLRVFQAFLTVNVCRIFSHLQPIFDFLRQFCYVFTLSDGLRYRNGVGFWCIRLRNRPSSPPDRTPKAAPRRLRLWLNFTCHQPCRPQDAASK